MQETTGLAKFETKRQQQALPHLGMPHSHHRVSNGCQTSQEGCPKFQLGYCVDLVDMISGGVLVS